VYSIAQYSVWQRISDSGPITTLKISKIPLSRITTGTKVRQLSANQRLPPFPPIV